jgi:hypothetical protein
MATRGQNACTTTDRCVNAGQVSAQIPELLANGLVNSVQARPLLFDDYRKLTTNLAPLSSGLMPEHTTHLSVHLIDQFLGRFTGLV